MSRRLDLPLAAAIWLGGFAWVRRTGDWLPLAVLAVLAAARLAATDPETKALLSLRPGALRLAAAASALMVGATFVLYRLLVHGFPGLPSATGDLYRVLHATGYSRAALVLFVLALSAAEEIVWRGRALAPARPDLHPRGTAHVTLLALFYGACHLTSGSPLLGVLAAACGAYWGFLRVKGRSLLPAILTHAAWDLAVLVAWPLA